MVVKKKGVIHVVRDTGGVAKMVIELANEQSRNGLKVVIFHTAFTDNQIKLLLEDVDVRKVNELKNVPPMLFGLRIANIYRVVQELYPEYNLIVHAHNIVTIGILSNICKVPVVCTIHGISWFGNITFRKRISRFLTTRRVKALHKNAGVKFVAVSDATAAYYNNMCKRNIVSRIYNGIYKDIEREPNGTLTIGFIGDISDSKGWEISIEAISLLSTKIRNSIKFIAAGRPIGYLEPEIKKQIDNLELSRGSEYLGLVTDAYHSVMSRVDLLLLPSISEGLPMSIIEAQSLGIPVIATPVGGIPEILKDGENGIVVERNSKSVSAAIEKICTKPDLYKEMSENSKESFCEKFTSEGMYNQYSKLYLTLYNK